MCLFQFWFSRCVCPAVGLLGRMAVLFPVFDAFELWCWRRLLKVPWTARRSNQFILKEISPECSLEGLMLKLKLQYFGHLMWRTDSFEKTLRLGKIEGRRRRDEMVGWHHRLNGHRFEYILGVGDGQGGLACCGSWGPKGLDTTERLNWTELNMSIELVMQSNHLILCRPLSSCLHSFPASGSFPLSYLFTSDGQSEAWSFSFSISPSNDYLNIQCGLTGVIS